MPTPANYWKLGFFVIAGAAVGLAAIVWFGASRLTRETIAAYAFFDESVSGLELGSPVKFRGVTIGRVSDIKTAPDRRHVEVKAELYTDALERLGLRDREHPRRPGLDEFVPADLRVQLVSSALTGLTFIQCDFFEPDKYPVPLYPFDVPWNTVHWVPSTYKSLERSIMETLAALPSLANDAASLMRRIERAIDAMHPEQVAAELAAAMDQLRALLGEARASSVVPRLSAAAAEAERALAEARGLAADLRGEEGPVQRVAAEWIASAQRLTAAIEEARIAAASSSIQRASDVLADAAAETVLLGRAVRDEMPELREALAAVRRLAELLERDPGALVHGRTLHSLPPSLNR